MIYRLAIVVAFAWSFSAVVRIEDATVRPEIARVSCGGLGGDGCARPLQR